MLATLLGDGVAASVVGGSVVSGGDDSGGGDGGMDSVGGQADGRGFAALGV